MAISRAEIRSMVEDYFRRGDPSGWFEELYRRADGDAAAIPWADLVPNPNFVSWAERCGLSGAGRRAVKVGCGLGDDAEELRRLGFRVTAFDISPTAIKWCRRRFPASDVEYLVADLFDPPWEWGGNFDLVLESNTLQSLLPELRPRAMEQVAKLPAPGGTLLVICRGKDEGEECAVWPAPMERRDLDRFKELGLVEENFEDFFDQEVPPVRRFRVTYRKPQAG
jgi:SAM-dependent methyltransferase